jgi:hypothetical protein
MKSTITSAITAVILALSLSAVTAFTVPSPLALAQDNAVATTATPAKPAPLTRQQRDLLALEIIIGAGTSEAFDAALEEGMTQGAKAAGAKPGELEQVLAKIRPLMAGKKSAMLKRVEEAMTKHYSDEGLVGHAAFVKSDAGRHVREAQIRMVPDLVKIQMDFAMEVVKDLK